MVVVGIQLILHDVDVFLLGNQIELMGTIDLIAFGILTSLESTRFDHHIFLIIDHCVEFLRGHAQQITNLIGQTTEIPNMSDGHHQFDVTTALATHFLLSDLYTTTVADNALIADALVLTATAFVVTSRTENALAEEAVALGLVCTIVFQDLLRRSQTDGNLREIILYLNIFFESHVSVIADY